jgi:hypothetical protein
MPIPNPDCRVLLAFWNLADDVARSVNGPFENHGGVLEDVYNKLFFGNNLLAMTPRGEQFQAEWTEDELGVLRTRIETAVDLSRSAWSHRALEPARYSACQDGALAVKATRQLVHAEGAGAVGSRATVVS